MKPASSALQALLASRQFYAADLYTFTLVGGGVLRYGGGDRDIVSGGNTFPAGSATGPYFDRKDGKAKFHQKVGIAVDTLVFDVLPGAATVNAQPFLSAVRAGVFDGAELQLERAFMPTYGDVSAGTVIVFAGRVAEIDCGRSLATFSVNSHLELLNLNLPRNLWMPGCGNTLGDASCAVNLASYAANASALAGSGTSVVNTTLAQPSGYYDLGKLQFTAGANSGLWRSVKQWVMTGGQGPNTGGLYLMTPLPAAPAPGDAFTVYPGCNKSLTDANGCPKFANQANFRGFPFVPIPETAL